MPHVITSDGRDLGEVTDLDLLTYYAGEGYSIDGSAPAARAASLLPNEGGPNALDVLRTAAEGAQGTNADLEQATNSLASAVEPTQTPAPEPVPTAVKPSLQESAEPDDDTDEGEH